MSITESEALKLAAAERWQELYAHATGRASWGKMLVGLIPGHMVPGMVRWVVFGVMPGDFMCSVIEGDLFEAYHRADEINANAMRNYVIFFHNYAPSGCFRKGALGHWSGILER